MIRILDWMNKWLAPLFSGVAALFGVVWQNDFAALRAKYPSWPGLFNYIEAYVPPLFVLFFILAGLCSVLRIFTQPSLGKLETKLNDANEKIGLIGSNIETLFNGILLRLSEKIDLDRGEASRLTVYIHDGRSDFISFGRYCPDTSYQSKGRNILPDNIGCIAKAWSGDWCFEPNLTYKESRKKYSMSRECYEPQRMKSTFFAVKRIESNRQPLAVLVLESKIPDRFTEVHIRGILDGEEAYLAELIDGLKSHIPDPHDALERGF